MPNLGSIAVALCIFYAAEPSLAQTPEEHASHHPEQAGGDAPASDSKEKGGGMGGMMGGEGGGMGGMMEKMGAPKPRDLYPTLMNLPELTPEKKDEVLAQAGERVNTGLALMGEGFDSLSTAASTENHAAMQEAVAKVREGLTRLDSGLAARRAIAEAKSPRNVALQWFKREMNLLPPAAEGSDHALGGSSFHLVTIAILAAFAVAMIWMYFFKMRRASALLKALASPGATAPATPPSADPTAAATAPPVAAPQPVKAEPPEFPAMKSRTVPVEKWSGKLRVCRIFDEAPGVKTFRLAAEDNLALPFTYYPGQFLTITLDIDGKTVKRSYTIASSPTQSHYYSLTIKREDMGLVSRHLHDRIKEGDLIDAAGPNGKFTFTGEEARSIVLVAGGVGITPMMSVIRYLTDIGWHGEIFLLYCCRTTRDFIFRNELEQLQLQHPNLNIFAFMTRAAGTVWMGFKGRFTTAVISGLIPEVQTRRIHICGPPAMMDAVVDMFRALKVPEEMIKTEAFGPAIKPAEKFPPAAVPVPENAPNVSFTKSGKSAPLPPGQTVLECAEAAGVDIDSSCLIGQCGLCKVRLLSGEVTMEVDDALSEEDKAGGMILACQAKSNSNLEVEA
jgi:ferredoxin-NADP reductase